MTNPSPHMCRNGHPRTPETTMLLARGEIKCRVCHYAAQARYRDKLRAARPVQLRLPLEPLLPWIPPPAGARTIAARCATTPTIVRRWMRTGLTPYEADVAAITVGAHPCEVWADWWELAA